MTIFENDSQKITKEYLNVLRSYTEDTLPNNVDTLIQIQKDTMLFHEHFCHMVNYLECINWIPHLKEDKYILLGKWHFRSVRDVENKVRRLIEKLNKLKLEVNKISMMCGAKEKFLNNFGKLIKNEFTFTDMSDSEDEFELHEPKQ